MPRATNNPASRKRRKKILKEAKGFWGKRKSVYKFAKQAVERKWQYQYIGRKLRKRNFRRLWIMRINAFTRKYGLSYSKFMGTLKKMNCNLNRKILAEMAVRTPAELEKIVSKVIEFLKEPNYERENTSGELSASSI